MSKTVGWFVLSWNRASILRQAMRHTAGNSGRPWDELIWVDNGSEQQAEMIEIMKPYQPTVQCLFKKNTGMQMGYNTCMSLSRCDYVVASGPDVLMPDDWLKTFMNYVETIPNTGLATMYSVPIDQVPERYRNGKKEVEYVNGLPLYRAMPFECYIIRRDVLAKLGYWREDFGLYGWGDVEWYHRAERILTEMGLDYYVIPQQIQHLADAGAEEFKLAGYPEEYQAWKQKESARSKNHEIMDRSRRANWPYYSPY